MGRWGVRLFEGDRDLDMVGDLEYLFEKEKKIEIDFSGLLNSRSGEEKDNAAAKIRAQLDADGTADELFKALRAKEREREGQYNVIIFGSLMMLAGVSIRQDHLQHLRELVPKINCNHRYVLPLWDSGFRGPGRAQFVAALDHYRPGVARDFVGAASCFQCGKVKADTGCEPRKCARCELAWYCGKDCQKAHWKLHKPSCVSMDDRSNGEYILMNV
ncbi:hypothetical protein MGN70_005386 [Eutypa lata]|uniref:MYND-type domain-containing protein n=1 Tax=Eutypa lata (strain UCR-EL1) TaxID=1287681 RepID=M7TQX4_EUTLA|nr:hypothetical protein UCREL1_600 [Eutypa lata UCREL1]KAI1253178.1 hypothetical protein MGN70_005386 [Eutypa lata]